MFAFCLCDIDSSGENKMSEKGMIVKMISKEKSVAAGTAEAGALGAAKDAVIPANYSINNTKSGHGIMAEEAQTIIDRLHGKTAEVVGRDNAKNGADRFVDGEYIQTKFYNSGKGCAAACFDGENGGMYKYIGPDGQPMPVEVPKDLRDAAVGEMRRRIADGKVPGVTDENRAEDLVRASDLTYEQSVKLCTPFTRESLLYDCASGFVRCAVLFVISAAASLILSLRGGKGTKRAFKNAAKSGGFVFILSYATHIICSQFARTALFKSIQFPPISGEGVFGIILSNIDVCMQTGAGGGYSSIAGAVGRFPKMLKTYLLATVISFVVFGISELARLILRKINAREFGLRISSIVLSKLGAVLFWFAAAAILGYYALLPYALNIAVCAASAAVGAVLARRLIQKNPQKT